MERENMAARMERMDAYGDKKMICVFSCQDSFRASKEYLENNEDPAWKGRGFLLHVDLRHVIMKRLESVWGLEGEKEVAGSGKHHDDEGAEAGLGLFLKE